MIDNLEEKRRFAMLLTGLSEYYRHEVSKALAGIYWEGLKQYDIAAIEKAAHAHMQSPDENGRWFPKISDIAKYLEGRTIDQAGLAWSKVDRSVRTVGPYADVAFDDPIIHRVIEDMGGWVAINGKEDKEWPFIAKEFCTRYQAFRMTGDTPEHPRYLIGMANAHNAHSGQQQGLQVRLLGNVEKARQIASGKMDAQIGITRKQLN